MYNQCNKMILILKSLLFKSILCKKRSYLVIVFSFALYATWIFFCGEPSKIAIMAGFQRPWLNTLMEPLTSFHCVNTNSVTPRAKRIHSCHLEPINSAISLINLSI